MEFCGGTHLSNTSSAKLFVIVEERSRAAGVRRITAYTGEAAKNLLLTCENFEKKLEAAKKLKGSALSDEIAKLTTFFEGTPLPKLKRPALQATLDALIEMKKEERKEIAKNAIKKAEAISAELRESPKPFYVVLFQAGSDRKALSEAAKILKTNCPATAFFLVSVDDAIALQAIVPDSLTAKLKAGDWIKAVATVCGGKGGGKADAASGSADDVSKVDEAIKAANEFAGKHLL
eukprot:TRINITY_DN1827_c0_g2_i1.p1 TRINITY_DN1827_c0_g2~~TRINITY_DN1827_c0_g2_i1.p1  ORF type:complete len:273 (-),score=88.23 TRINITY_DN1827_c0_g2_i1:83-784(-)